MDIATAKQLSNLYFNVKSMVGLISQGAILNYQCQNVTNIVAADPNFLSILSVEEQTWVTTMVSFFNSLPGQLPTIPVSIINAIQS